MEPALPLPLRLQLSHAPVPLEHDAVSESISAFLAAYAARTGTSNASSADDPTAANGAGSTGGVVAAQLTRLMNGLQGKIDYDAFSAFISSQTEAQGEAEDGPMEVVTDDLPATQEVEADTQEAQPQEPLQEEDSPKKKHKKDKKDKKEKRVKHES